MESIERHDFKALYRKLEAALAKIERTENVSRMLETILRSLVDDFREALGFRGGRLYRRDGSDFVLAFGCGESKDAPVGLVVPPGYPPHERTLREGLIIGGAGDPGYDPVFEGAIGVTSRFAAIAVGQGSAYIIALSVDQEVPEDRILYSLSAVRHVIHLKLEQQWLAGLLEDARIIQESLLPANPPEFPGYDIAGRSRPAEVVGGDLYDYIRLSDSLLGVAIGDASGHGLPAALLARDVVTGLRVAMDEDLKLARVMERLNRVIHRAALSSRFISVFYGELDRDGTMTYCNAGHNPPLLLSGAEFSELRTGGLILGPNPAARYEAGHMHLRAGDLILLYSDGLTERPDPRGRHFGVRRLRSLLRDHADLSAREIIEALFAASDEHGGPTAPDDRTAVVVKRL